MNEEENNTDFEDFGESSVPVYVSAAFIALAGLGFLALSLYYIIYLPVPTLMQPLKTRVLLVLGMEEAKKQIVEEERYVVSVIEEESVPAHAEPNEDSEVFIELPPGSTYTVLQKIEGWYKIMLENGYTEAWVREHFLLVE